jgi:Fe-S cluster biosynthesis and repair protein YggX
MSLTCSRCGQTAEPPASTRVAFSKTARDRVLASICGNCFGQWEDVEIRAINEYRLNLVDPEDRRQLEAAGLDFLFGAEKDPVAG